MTDRIVWFRVGFLLLIASASTYIWANHLVLTSTSGLLEVHFLDVGQGDAVFIETPDGVQVLIDGGASARVIRELSAVMALNDRTIDLVVATHPDTDHVGGLVDVLKRYDIQSFLVTENKSDSQAAQSFVAAIEAENTYVQHARRGQEIGLGASTTLRVLFPDTNPAALESNASSIIVQLQYGDIEVMLTGDSPKSIEEYLVLVEGEALESEVLKVGHHGSRTSTSELFLAEVDPQYAVISAGKDNRYNHPHTEVTDVLFNNRIETFTTADSGSVTFASDGVTVWPQ